MSQSYIIKSRELIPIFFQKSCRSWESSRQSSKKVPKVIVSSSNEVSHYFDVSDLVVENIMYIRLTLFLQTLYTTMKMQNMSQKQSLFKGRSFFYCFQTTVSLSFCIQDASKKQSCDQLLDHNFSVNDQNCGFYENYSRSTKPCSHFTFQHTLQKKMNIQEKLQKIKQT